MHVQIRSLTEPTVSFTLRQPIINYSKLLHVIWTKLNNKDIQLITEVEKIENKKMIYTNSEKFDFLGVRDLRTEAEVDQLYVASVV